MNLSKTNILLAGVFLLANFANAEVILSGAGSMARALTPKQPDMEAASGVTIKIVSKNTGLGIKDLLAGKANLAMVTGPLALGCEVLEIPKSDASGLKASVVDTEGVSFIVHPDNTVSSLSAAQVKDIFTGKVTNWKDVGGADLPIKVYAAERSVGFRLAVEEQLLGGNNLVSTAEERSKSADIIPAISQQAGAIAFVANSDVKPGVKVIESSAVSYPLQLVSKGEPTADELKVIEAAKKALQ